MPTSMLRATLFALGNRKMRPRRKPMPRPSRLCAMTTAMTTNPAVISLSALCETTMPTTMAMARADNAGRAGTTLFVFWGENR